MKPHIEKLKRYYNSEPQKITIKEIDNLLANGKITQEEYDYIIASDEVE